jgi:hypothetical protein
MDATFAPARAFCQEWMYLGESCSRVDPQVVNRKDKQTNKMHQLLGRVPKLVDWGKLPCSRRAASWGGGLETSHVVESIRPLPKHGSKEWHKSAQEPEQSVELDSADRDDITVQTSAHSAIDETAEDNIDDALDRFITGEDCATSNTPSADPGALSLPGRTQRHLRSTVVISRRSELCVSLSSTWTVCLQSGPSSNGGEAEARLSV